MELLWEAMSSSATLCWLMAQLTAFGAGRRDPEKPRSALRKALSLISTVLYVVALILLIQLGFGGRWMLLLTVLELVIPLTVGFSLLRYFIFRRSARAERESDQGKESDVHPR